MGAGNRRGVCRAALSERGRAGAQQQCAGYPSIPAGTHRPPSAPGAAQLGELPPDQLLPPAGKGAKLDRLLCDKCIFDTFKLNTLSKPIQSGPNLPNSPGQPHAARAPVAIARQALSLLATK